MGVSKETRGFGGGRALVVGAGMAGLVTARILSPHFERVTLVERDRAPSAAEPRKGVAQGRHVHVLLGAGLVAMVELFPGILDELIADGAWLGDFGEDAAWYHHGVWKVQFASGIPLLHCSRALLEHHIRRRVLTLSNVEMFEETTALGLCVSADGMQVAGLRVERAGRVADEIAAALVVDASGRGSRAPSWLERAGYARPKETRVGIDMAYVSRFYRRAPHDRGRSSLIALYPRPPEQKRMGFLFSIEGDRWLMSMSGYFGEHPPLDEAGFLAFARTLPRPEIYERIKDAEPLTAPCIYKFPANRRRHFESMQRYLEGFLVLGDAACSFNPIFGQGMTVACLGARALDRCLREQAQGEVRGLAERFQGALAAVTDLPWRLAIGEDLRYPQTTGERSWGFGALSWYTEQIQVLSSRDTRVYGRFLLVLHLFRGLDTLFAPSVVAAVIGHVLRRLFAPLARQTRMGSEPLRKEDPATRALLRSYCEVVFGRAAKAPSRPRQSPRLRRISPTTR